MRKELKIAIELCCEFSRKFNIKFPKDEIGYSNTSTWEITD